MSVIYSTVQYQEEEQRRATQALVRRLIESNDIPGLEQYKTARIDWLGECIQAVKQENLELITYLLDNTRFNRNGIHSSGQTLLSVACTCMDDEVLKLLLESGCTGIPSTYVGDCILNCKSDKFELLLKHGVDPNGICDGVPLLSLSLDHPDPGYAKKLLEANADPNTIYKNRSPLEYCIERGDVHMSRLLLGHGAELEDVEQMMWALPDFTPTLRQIRWARKIGIPDETVMLYPGSTLQSTCIVAISQTDAHDGVIFSSGNAMTM